MAAEKYRRRYYLFTEKEHESIRLDYPADTKQEFIRLWNEGHGIKTICKKLRLQEIEFALITLSLSYSGLIKQRKRGIHGKGA